MKKHKDILYTLIGVGVIALLILITYKSKQPKPIELEFSEQPKTQEHSLVEEILADTEAFATAEDARVDTEAQTSQPLSQESTPLPVAGAPLPVAWDSKPAPTIDEVELSPSLQRSLAASAELRSETYTNPNSEFNLARVAELREIRKKRQEANK